MIGSARCTFPKAPEAYLDDWAGERLDLLDPSEADLYQDLVENSFGPSVRLEQERIQFSAIERAIRSGDGVGSRSSE